MCKCQIPMARDDAPSVGTTDEDCLRRFVACRDRGDATGATIAWRELVEVSYDRVRSLVEVWSYTHTRLGEAEREEATQRALITMFERLGHTFEGVSMGQLHNALGRLVGFRCLDVIDEAVKARERTSGLDATWVDHEGREHGQHPGEAAEAAWRWTRDAEVAEATAIVQDALARLEDGPKRTVVERTLDGVPAEEIADELGVTMANLYQLRRRGLVALRSIIEQMEPDA